MPSAEAQANALITLLESLQPRWALTPHLSRLERLVAELKGSSPDTGGEELVSAQPLSNKTNQFVVVPPPSPSPIVAKAVQPPIVVPTTKLKVANPIVAPSPSPILAKPTQAPIVVPTTKSNSSVVVALPPSPSPNIVFPPKPLVVDIPTSSTQPKIDNLRPNGPSAAQQVWNDQSLLSRILDFDGSLGYYFRHYDLFVGYERPTPLPQTLYLSHRCGTRGVCLVNKACHRLTLGQVGLSYLQVSYQTKLEKQVAIAKATSRDSSVSWLARVYALAMADDALSLDSILRVYLDPQQPPGPFGAALDLYYDEEYFELRLPLSHPFDKCAVTDLVEFRLEYDGENRQEALIAELAYNACRVGAMRALEILKRHFGWGLYYLEFDDKRGGDFLSTFIQYALAQPFYTPHAQVVRTLLRGEAIGPESHGRLASTVGNLLHLTAAKGDYELMASLLDCGFDPSYKCEQGNCFYNHNDERQACQKVFPLPEHWAKVRGHHAVATMLQQRREKLRPCLRQRFQGRPFCVGKLTRFFAEPNRMYGFITPEDGQQHLFNGGNNTNGVFVHISNLQRGARQDGHSNLGCPTPGLKLAFTVRKDRRGRQRADVVISGDDFSYVNLLQMSPERAEDWWGKYHRDGSDYESDEETDNDSYAPQHDEDEDYPDVPALIQIPLGYQDGYHVNGYQDGYFT